MSWLKRFEFVRNSEKLCREDIFLKCYKRNPHFHLMKKSESSRLANIIKCKITDEEGGEKCDLGYGVFNLYLFVKKFAEKFVEKLV